MFPKCESHTTLLFSCVCVYSLIVVGCPIKDYSPLLKIPPLHHLEIDEKVVEALGMENIKKHHPNAEIIVQQKISSSKD